MIGNSVMSIGKEAFSGCDSLTSVTIGNSVTSIESSTFRKCNNLTSIKVEAGNTTYDSRDKCNGIIETASNTLIVGCKKTFIPNRVTSIGKSAFYDCSGLTSITIPSSVTSIGSYAFFGCSGLTSITIPNSVTSIGERAFGSCYLQIVISKIENPFEIRNDVFINGYNSFLDATLYVPIGTIDKYKSTYGWKNFVYIKEGEPTGIPNIEGDGTKELKRYTLDGRSVKNSHQGINIIQMNNGTTKKVVVK